MRTFDFSLLLLLIIFFVGLLFVPAFAQQDGVPPMHIQTYNVQFINEALSAIFNVAGVFIAIEIVFVSTRVIIRVIKMAGTGTGL